MNPTFTKIATSGTCVHSHYTSAQHICTGHTYVRNHILCPIYVHTQVTHINLTHTIGFLCESLLPTILASTHYFSADALFFIILSFLTQFQSRTIWFWNIFAKKKFLPNDHVHPWETTRNFLSSQEMFRYGMEICRNNTWFRHLQK